MKIRSYKEKPFYVLYVLFVFVLINSAILLTISNGYQTIFGQGYIPPPASSSLSNNLQSSQSTQPCAQIAFIGPGYKDSNGCTRPCPTGGASLPGCPPIYEQPGRPSTPTQQCPQITSSGP